MNKILTASILAAVVPLSLQVFAAQSADTAVTAPKKVLASQDSTNKQNMKEMDKKAVDPVDLELAAQQYDIVLPPQPVKMTADSLYVRNQDGYVQGRGNVDIYQGMDELHGNYVEGNMKTQLYYIPGSAVWIQNGTVLNGSGFVYNGKTKGGTMEYVSGFLTPTVYIRGTDGEVYDGNGYIRKGLITTPHAVAETPDYYLTGEDIHIYPGDKYTSENTKLWFKHLCVLTYGHYEGRLDGRHKTNPYIFSLLPRPHYTANDGFGVYGGAEFPLNLDESFRLEVKYALHTKSGFQPTFRFIRDTILGQFTLGYSTEESTQNTDRVWAKKFPELNYYMPRINFGRTGVYMDNSASWGRWAEDGVETGTHKGFKTEISHTPIPLWKQANIRFFVGYRKDMYSTDDDMIRDPYNGVGVSQQINDRLWTYWWYTKHNMSGATPYRFDTIDHPRQKGVTIGYRMTPLDTFVLTFDKDLDTSEVADRNITWVRDLHSFVASITWKSVTREWDLQVVAKDF